MRGFSAESKDKISWPFEKLGSGINPRIQPRRLEYPGAIYHIIFCGNELRAAVSIQLRQCAQGLAKRDIGSTRLLVSTDVCGTSGNL
jgi:hypothetical protein